MSYLLSKYQPDGAQGLVQSITPQSAGWQYVGFKVYELNAGDSIQLDANEDELCLVLVLSLIHI